MDRDDLSSMMAESLNLPGNSKSLDIPYLVKAGSGSSPSILSPRNENDFFLSTSAATVTPQQKYCNVSAQETGRDSAILNSVASPPPQGQAGGALPLFSPSEVSIAPQSSAALFTAGLAAAQPFAGIATTINSALDPSLPTPPDNNVFNLRLPQFNQLGIASPHPNDFQHNEAKLLIQSVLPDRITITSPIRAPRPHLRNSDSIEFDVGANTPYIESIYQPIEHNYFPQPLLSKNNHPELLDVLTPPDDEPDVKLEIRWMPPHDKLGDEHITESTQISGYEGEQAVAGAWQGGSIEGQSSSAGGQVPSESMEETEAPIWLEDALRAISE